MDRRPAGLGREGIRHRRHAAHPRRVLGRVQDQHPAPDARDIRAGTGRLEGDAAAGRLGRPGQRLGRPVRPRRRARRRVLRVPPGHPHRPGRRLVRAWSIASAAIDERQTGADLVAGHAAFDALLLDKGFAGHRFAAEIASAEIEVIIPPARAQRQAMPRPLQRLIARLRNRVETSFNEITDQMELARHGAHTFEGLLTRTVAVLAAQTLLLTSPM